MVSLKEGERWVYDSPENHDVVWLAVADGALIGAVWANAGDLVIFERQRSVIEVEAAASGETIFVLGSAVAHPHDLVLGNYSVHTSTEALRKGGTQIAALAAGLPQTGDHRRGGAIPVYR